MARNSSTAFRKVAKLIIIRDGGICGVCGHGDAITVDHIISHKDWPRDSAGELEPGLDDPANLRAAHGSRGVGEHNPCHECRKENPARWPNGRFCNQSRGAGTIEPAPAEPHSRNW